MQYLVQSDEGEVAILAFDCEIDAPGTDSMELSLRRVDFNWFIEGFVIDQDMLMGREML
jgi:hypothetical protein